MSNAVRIPDWVLADASFFRQFSPYSPPPFAEDELQGGVVTRGPFVFEIGKKPKKTVVGLNLQFAELDGNKVVLWSDGLDVFQLPVVGKVLKDKDTLRFVIVNGNEVVLRKITGEDARYVSLSEEEDSEKMLTKDLIEAIRKKYL